MHLMWYNTFINAWKFDGVHIIILFLILLVSFVYTNDMLKI